MLSNFHITKHAVDRLIERSSLALIDFPVLSD